MGTHLYGSLLIVLIKNTMKNLQMLLPCLINMSLVFITGYNNPAVFIKDFAHHIDYIVIITVRNDIKMHSHVDLISSLHR